MGALARQPPDNSELDSDPESRPNERRVSCEELQGAIEDVIVWEPSLQLSQARSVILGFNIHNSVGPSSHSLLWKLRATMGKEELFFPDRKIPLVNDNLQESDTYIPHVQNRLFID
jgi:hypothetical protein